MRYVASTVPIMKEGTILECPDGVEPKEVKVDTLDFVSGLGAGDELWLMMGSTNAAVALGAYRRGVEVHQVSHARALPHVRELLGKKDGERVKIEPDAVFFLAGYHPELFYGMYPQQGEVLEVVSAWQEFTDTMEARKAYANLVRARMQREAVVRGTAESAAELKELIDERVGTNDPQDPAMQAFMAREKDAERELSKVLGNSVLWERVFEPVSHVGPKLAARFIAGIERIERFESADDLMRYAGMLPTRGGKLPARRKGNMLSRSPELNNACYMFQEQMFKYGRNSQYGQLISAQIERECPCTAEERKHDADLRKRHSGAVKRARIAVSREFLTHVFNGWREVMAV